MTNFSGISQLCLSTLLLDAIMMEYILLNFIYIYIYMFYYLHLTSTVIFGRFRSLNGSKLIVLNKGFNVDVRCRCCRS